MDYYKFLDDYNSYNEWNNIQEKEQEAYESLSTPKLNSPYPPFQTNARSVTTFGGVKDDRVNSPSHYCQGKQEAIDIIEDAVKTAPSNIYGMLQAQVLKYLLRVWVKDNPLEDLKKARWYLNRLIEHMENPPGDNFPGDNIQAQKW